MSFSTRHRFPATWFALPLATLAGLLLALLPLTTAAGLLGGAAVLLLVAIQPLVGLGLALLAGPWGAHESLVWGNQLFDSGQVLLLITLAAWIGRGLAHRRVAVPQTVLNFPLLLFITVATFSLFQAESWRLGLKELIKWLEMLGVMWMVVDLGRDFVWRIRYSAFPDRASANTPCISGNRQYAIGFTLFALLLAGLSQAVIGIWQFSRGTGVEHFVVLGRFYRAYGTFYQPNPFGGFMALNAALAGGALVGYLTWRVKRGARSVERMVRSTLLAFSAAATALGLFVSWSRGAWLGFAAAAATLAFFWPRRRWLGVVMVVAAAGLLLLAAQFNLLPASITSRITSFTADFRLGDVRGVDIYDENYAVIERLAHWQAAVEMARAHPWLGVGFGNYEAAYPEYRLMNWIHPLGHAHNYYLNITAETGFLGAAAYLFFWAAVLWQSVRQLGRLDWPWRGLALGLLAAWVYLSVHHLVDKLYVNNLYIHLGTMLGLQQLLENENISSDLERSSVRGTSFLLRRKGKSKRNCGSGRMMTILTNTAVRFGIKPKEAERFVKFLIVGTLGFVIDFGLLAFLVEVVKMPDLVVAVTGLSDTIGLIAANTISFTAAVLSNFSFNRYWTYPESRSKRKRVQLPQFTLVSVVGLLLNNAILALLHTPFDRLLVNFKAMPITVNGYIPAKIVATIVVLFWNFFINRYWTYSNVE